MKPGARKGLFRSGHHDRNHGLIAKRLTHFGPEAIDTTKVGGGYPDLTWPYQGLTVLIEVKVPGGSLTPAQERFIAEWRGGPLFVITNEEEVPQMISTLHNLWLPKRRKVLG